MPQQKFYPKSINIAYHQEICKGFTTNVELFCLLLATPSQTQIPPLELPRYGGGRQGRYSLYRHSPQAGTPQQVRTHSKGYWAKTETGWDPTKARGIANPANMKKTQNSCGIPLLSQSIRV